MSIRDELKKRARELGFDLVGIAPASPGQDLEFVSEWLRSGYGGEMAYLANPKRRDPALVLPSVSSVICVGLIYDTPFPYSTEVGSRQQAEGRKQESGGRSQEAGDSRGAESIRQPSPAGRGWSPPGRGTGEGHEREAQTSSFDFRISNFQFPVSESQFPVSNAAAPRAWISRYAWGRDYHEIMREKLENLRAAIEELAPGTETRVYVDTGPVSERAFARFSGLGWMGKNTCIIHEEKGSWFFLGVILINLALAPDLPAPDRCGTCRACLDACPTGALVEPYVMDASRCISYLTIELKSSIPLELRPGIGTNIFGCDICQDVCPWNAKNRSQKPEIRGQEREFRPLEISSPTFAGESPTKDEGLMTRDKEQEDLQPANAGASPIQNPKSKIQNSPSPQNPASNTLSLFNPPLAVLASLTEDDFRQTFRHSPIRRAKYRGWLRNLCVAMGNSGDPRLIPKLKELASHSDAIVREHAEWALEQIQHPPGS